jgi:hypothetical protein
MVIGFRSTSAGTGAAALLQGWAWDRSSPVLDDNGAVSAASAALLFILTPVEVMQQV